MPGFKNKLAAQAEGNHFCQDGLTRTPLPTGSREVPLLSSLDLGVTGENHSPRAACFRTLFIGGLGSVIWKSHLCMNLDVGVLQIEACGGSEPMIMGSWVHPSVGKARSGALKSLCEEAPAGLTAFPRWEPWPTRARPQTRALSSACICGTASAMGLVLHQGLWKIQKGRMVVWSGFAFMASVMFLLGLKAGCTGQWF